MSIEGFDPVFNAGMQAFAAAETLADNPYPESDERAAKWARGWEMKREMSKMDAKEKGGEQ